MQSPCIREASEACFHGWCPDPLPELHSSTSKSTTITSFRYDFNAATASSLHPNTQFTNHESLPPLEELYSNLNKAFPQYSETNQADQIREKEYDHLSSSNHVCLDYIGHGLFSYSQQTSNVPFFDIYYKSANLKSQMLYGIQESEFESRVRKRIMRYMNISEDDYSLVFTANQSSAFKLVADSYPFHSNRNLVTVYDYENEAVQAMTESSKKKGARVVSAEFSWPNLRIQSRKLTKIIVRKRKKRERGLFVFPLQSRMTGAKYSYLWMSIAQENGWHVLLDACALGSKDMETLGLSLFRPDFLICSFFKVFGENPSGFGCLFVKKSSASVLTGSNTNMGIVSLVPATRPFQFLEQSFIIGSETRQQTSELELKKDNSALPGSSSSTVSIKQRSEVTSEVQEIQEVSTEHKELSSSEIVELDKTLDNSKSRNTETIGTGSSQMEFRGLDHADSLGLILISSRARYLVNWLVNALMSLRHPHSENGLPLVRIYGPKIKVDRGPAMAFNVFDWKGEKVDPTLVQKLADRNNISLSYGFLQHICFCDTSNEDKDIRTTEDLTDGNKKRNMHKSGMSVITASLGFLTNFEDIYRLWAFVSRFLDADFVEKERWRYMALNRTTLEI